MPSLPPPRKNEHVCPACDSEEFTEISTGRNLDVNGHYKRISITFKCDRCQSKWKVIYNIISHTIEVLTNERVIKEHQR
jgi:hypothetical protein